MVIVRILECRRGAGSESRVAPAGVVTNAMRKRVVRVEGYTVLKAALKGKQQSVVVLRAAIDDGPHSSDFIGGCGIQEAQRPARLRVCDCRARCTRWDCVICRLAVQEASTVCIAIARNIDGRVEHIRSLSMSKSSSEVAHGNHRSCDDFLLDAQSP